MDRIWADVERGGHDAVVTTGGPQSNHARAAAIKSAEAGLVCHIVVMGDPEIIGAETGNLLLMRLSGAVLEFCRKEQIAERMDAAMERYRAQGRNPIYIWGGGHSSSGTHALVLGAQEAQEQCGEWVPEYLVHASGTGTTQAGLMIGYQDLPTRVIGISVARATAHGRGVIAESLAEFEQEYASTGLDGEIDFRDEWTAGGYEATSAELIKVIETAATAGMFVDPTYSGKGLHGLVDLVRNGTIPPGSRVLFWHTGGLLNLQASAAQLSSVS